MTMSPFLRFSRKLTYYEDSTFPANNSDFRLSPTSETDVERKKVLVLSRLHGEEMSSWPKYTVSLQRVSALQNT